MISHTEGQIYLSGQRGCTQLPWFRSFYTFNFGSYQEESRAPFGNLLILNDDTLAAGRRFSMQIEENTEVILLPVVGAVEYKNSLGAHDILDAGQVQLFSAPAGATYELANPYEKEPVNFIQIWLRNSDQTFVPKVQEKGIDLETRNQLFPLFAPKDDQVNVHQNSWGFIGKYGGRAEGLHILQNPGSGIFVFVIEGAFEVQNRLMEARDGLALWNLDEVEFEALSNDAIILLLELPYN